MVYNIVEIVITKNKTEDIEILADLEGKIKEYYVNKKVNLDKIYTTYSESDRIPIFTPIVIFRDNSEYCLPKFQINLENIVKNLDYVFNIKSKEEIYKKFPQDIAYLDNLLLELNNEKKIEEENMNKHDLNEDIPFIINDKRRAESLKYNIINAHLMSLNMFNGKKDDNVSVSLSNADDEFFNKLN